MTPCRMGPDQFPSSPPSLLPCFVKLTTKPTWPRFPTREPRYEEAGPRAARAVRGPGAIEEAKLEDLHFHDLRHHFASQFVMRGGSLPALQKILGHADLKMTLRYAHLAPHYLRDEIARTERPAQTAAKITQAITHEPVAEVSAAEAAR